MYLLNTPSFTIAASDAPTTIQAKSDYVCDGVNDSSIIQDVINDVPNGAELNFSIGTFIFHNPLRYGDYFSLRGNGYATMFTVPDNATLPYILCNDGFNEIKFSKVEGILLDGNQSNINHVIDGIYYKKGSWNTLNNIYVQNFTGNGIHLFGNEPGGFCDENTLNNCTVQYCNTNGIFVDVASDNLITNCNLYGNGITSNSYLGAINLNGGTSNGINNCNIHTNNSNGIMSSLGNGTRIMGSDVRNNNMNGLFSDYDQYMQVEGNTFESNGTGNVNYLSSGILIYDGIYNSIIGNSCVNYGSSGSQDYGIYMQNASSTLPGPDYFIIKNNILHGNNTNSLVSIGSNDIISDNLF
jgi:parallel beta-helix repeat protein